MDQAVSLLTSIYDVYKTIKDGQDQFHATYERMRDLLGQLQLMQANDTLVQSQLLDKYLAIAEDFLKYLDKYKKRKFLSKVFHQKEMLGEIEGFNQQLEALFQMYHLAMGAHVVEHSRAQEASMDELVRGVRELLQGSAGVHPLKTEQSSVDVLAATRTQKSGPIAKAQADGDVATLVGLLTNNNQIEEAGVALFELAEEESMRDAIVQAGAIPIFLRLLRDNDAGPTSSAINATITRTLRRLAVRDDYEATIVKSGGIDVLASMLLSEDRTEEETTSACAALANLVFQAEHKLILLRTPHLVEKIVEIVRSGSASQKKHAANMLSELAGNEECALAINKAGGITALVDMLHISAPDLCASSLVALWNLSSLETNRTEIAAVGGINAIVAQVRRGATDEQRQLAASALAVLAEDDANDALIGAAGGVELLVKLLQTGTDGQKNSAAWALAELANSEVNANAMLRAGVAPALMAAFRSGPAIQRTKAGRALVWIAEYADDMPALVDEIGTSSIVSLLRGSADQKDHAASIVASMARHDEFQIKLGELGAIELLVDLAGHSSTAHTALKALAALATDNEANQIKVGQAGGIGVIVSAIAAAKFDKQGESDGLGEALAALGAVAQPTELMQKATEDGAVVLLLNVLDQGSLAHKQEAAEILVPFMSELPEDPVVEMCVQVFIQVLVSSATEFDDELVGSALNAFTHLTLREDACTSFVDKFDGVRIMLELQPRLSNEDQLGSWGIVLANVAQHEKFQLTVADTGALEYFNSQLTSTSEVLQPMAIYGIALLSVNEEVCKRIAATRGMCRRIVKVLETGLTDEAKQRAAETIWYLSTHQAIAVELGQLHGLDELVTLVQSEDPDTVMSAIMALNSLSAVPENLEVLVEIGAIDAAATASEADNEEVQTAALELVRNLSSISDAAQQIVAGQVVVPLCVSALQNESNDRKQVGLAILVNVLKSETASEVPADDDTDAGGGEDEYAEDEEEEMEGGDEEEDAEAGYGADSLVGQLLEAGGISPLVDLLEDSALDGHADIMLLLDALAAADDSAKRKIGGCLTLLLEFLRDGTPTEQSAAAAAIVTLVTDSKRNAATAIRGRVADAFVQLLGSELEIETLKEHVVGLLHAFKAAKTTEATAANKAIGKAVVARARSDDAAQARTGFSVLHALVESAALLRLAIDAGTLAACVETIKSSPAEDDPTVELAGSVMVAIAHTKYGEKLIDDGHLADLMPRLEPAPSSSSVRSHIAEAATCAIRDFPDYVDSTGATEHVHAVVAMVQSGTREEKGSGAELLAAIVDAAPATLAELPLDALLDETLAMLASTDDEDDDGTFWSHALRLVASLARQDVARVAQRKALLERVHALLFDEQFEWTGTAIDAVDALLGDDEARAFFVGGDVETRLAYLQSWYPALADAAAAALETLHGAEN